MAWYDMRESGSRAGIRLTLALLRVVPYGAMRALIAVIAFYYALFAGGARRAIADFQRAALGRTTFRTVHRTLFRFAESILDRACALIGRASLFRLAADNEAGSLAMHAGGQGVLVLGAHLGTLEMARAFHAARGVRFSMLIYSARSSVLYQEFRRISPGVDDAMIEIDPDGVTHLLEVRERLARGEFVGVLADRVWRTGPTATVPFLGRDRAFPTGPYLLAAALKCPIQLMFMFKTGPRDYRLVIEDFASIDDLPARAQRHEGAQRLAGRFAQRLEHHCRRHPDQWYNFFDFWAGPDADSASGGPPRG